MFEALRLFFSGSFISCALRAWRKWSPRGSCYRSLPPASLGVVVRQVDEAVERVAIVEQVAHPAV